MLSQDQADQVEQILCCLQKEHTEHLHHLLDTYTNHQATIGKDTVNICYFLNAEFEFSRIPRRNLYILSFPDDCRQDWFLGLSQANDLVYALREGWGLVGRVSSTRFSCTGSNSIRCHLFLLLPRCNTFLNRRQSQCLPATHLVSGCTLHNPTRT